VRSSYLAGALLMLRCLELRADPTGSREARDLTRETLLYSPSKGTLKLHSVCVSVCVCVCVCVCVYLGEYRDYGFVKGQLAVGQTLDEPVGGA